MSRSIEGVKGACLCGEVKYQLNGQANAFHICHCSRCRQHTGSAHASNIFASADNIEWLSGQNAIQRFELPNAQHFAKQFCKHCGSPVPHLSRDGSYLIIPAGSLQADIEFAPQDNIFWSSKACWYESGRDSVKYNEYPED